MALDLTRLVTKEPLIRLVNLNICDIFIDSFIFKINLVSRRYITQDKLSLNLKAYALPPTSQNLFYQCVCVRVRVCVCVCFSALFRVSGVRVCLCVCVCERMGARIL